jgi:uncharacterized protein (DUF488 family)
MRQKGKDTAMSQPNPPKPSLPPIFTAGYEGRVQDELFDALISAGVRVLLDVRAVPMSRKAGFSKRVLAASAEARGVRYVHIQPLGTPKAGRVAARAGHAAEMERIFSAHMKTEAAQAGLVAARVLAMEAPICLLCFERDHLMCHRRLVAEMISTETKQPIVNL